MVKEVLESSITSPQRFHLYFKGLVGDNSLAGFGVAICGQNNDLLFQMKGPIFGFDITVLEAELTAMKRGLTEAVGLGIGHILIYCDYFPIYELITGKSVDADNKLDLLLRDVQLIRKQFASSYLYSVSEERIRYAYKLARETIVSKVTIHVDPPRKAKPMTLKKTCSICLDDDINADQMFLVERCYHKFCSQCVKRHIEVRLLEGNIMTCPHYRCLSKLTFGKCVHLLTPKLKEMWEQKIKEDSVPFVDRVYCPNPRCSALMSKTELSKYSKGAGAKRCCIKCGEPFCINCKVLWHNNLSCIFYSIFHPNPTTNDGMLKALANQRLWRQCGRCQHMIELSDGCVRVKCRCGHTFCYQCGGVAGGCSHGYGLPPRPPQPPRQPQQPQLPSVRCRLSIYCGFVLLCGGIFYHFSKKK